jgi:hypothetical protein
MRVAVDNEGVVTSAGDDLPEPFISFPVNWPPNDLVGLKVVTGLSGSRLLVKGSQVIARDDMTRGTGLINATVEAAATAAVERYMAANPAPASQPGAKGAKGDTGEPGPKGAPGSSVATMRTSVPQTLPVILASAKTDVTFTWSAPFPSATYGHDVVVQPSVAGKATVTVKSKTAEALTVTVTASSVVAAGATAVAIAWA